MKKGKQDTIVTIKVLERDHFQLIESSLRKHWEKGGKFKILSFKRINRRKNGKGNKTNSL